LRKQALSHTGPVFFLIFYLAGKTLPIIGVVADFHTFNSTASTGLTPSLFPSEQTAGNYPVYTFSNPGKPYAVDYFNSRAQVQIG
jgi:hypothetical protein